MKVFLATLLLSVSVFAKDLNGARVLNLITDDEGTKVIAQVGKQKPVVVYVSQSTVGYENLTAALQKAKDEKKPIHIKTKDSDLSLVTQVKEK